MVLNREDLNTYQCGSLNVAFRRHCSNKKRLDVLTAKDLSEISSFLPLYFKKLAHLRIFKGVFVLIASSCHLLSTGLHTDDIST